MRRFDDWFSVRHYPTGESLVYGMPRSLYDIGHPLVLDKCFTFERLAQAVVANRILNRQGVQAEWFIPYFPFARDDRRNNPEDGSCLELAIEMAKELNPVVLDPHSDVAGQMRQIPQRVFVEHVKRDFYGPGFEHCVWVVPDQGATKKAHSWLFKEMPWVQGVKHRDTATGKLTGFGILPNGVDPRGKHCIIVDDICDGGGTFLGLAKVLQDLGAETFTLAVAHGLFTNGLTDLLNTFEHIYIAGDPYDYTHQPRVRVIPYEDLYKKENIV